MYNSIIHHCMVSCLHHPKSNLLPSSFTLAFSIVCVGLYYLVDSPSCSNKKTTMHSISNKVDAYFSLV